MADQERKKPFSSLEKDIFLSVIQKYEHVLSCKKTNASSALKKKECWEQVKDEFNASTIVTQKASCKQLIKLWYNMKAKAREAKTKENVRFLTGGGSSVPDMDPVDAKVMDIDKNILTNIDVDIDSDVNGIASCFGDTNDNAWGKGPDIEDDVIILPPPLLQPSTSNIINSKEGGEGDVAYRTPSKRNFREKYMNKVDVLKIKILEEELSFKKRIHEEEIQTKIMERDSRKKILEVELQLAMQKLKNKNNEE